MKKIVLLISLIIFIGFGYIIINRKSEQQYKLLKNVEEDFVNITNYYVYGTHFNIEGNLDISNMNVNKDDVSLVLKSDNDEYELDALFEMNNNLLSFKTTEYINTGINLDSLPEGDWYLFLKVTGEEVDKYYTLSNQTNYENVEYYTITKDNKNNKIDIIFDKIIIDDKNIDYVSVNIHNSKLPEDVYDITIDPGHGGIDPGASHKLNGITYNEADLTLEIALKLKKQLEKDGYKVLLTRDSDEDLDYYGDNGRAVLPNKYHTKLSLSLHLNSESNAMTYGGVEVYVPNDSDYTLARLLAKNIAAETGIGYSKKVSNKEENGVYFNYFTQNDIEESNNNLVSRGMNAYDIEVGAPEMYMIREVGGIMTHAYVDGRNDYYGKNNYYNSNQTAEGYLIELAYISYENDLKQLVNNSSKFAGGLESTIKEYYK